jgi:hypothetical protein
MWSISWKSADGPVRRIFGAFARFSGSIRRVSLGGRAMKIAMYGLVLAACLPALTVLATQPTSAMSAFAVGVPDDVAKDGVALGEGHNFTSRDEAESRAINECRTNKDSSDAVHALCKLIDHFDNRCLAVSLDPKAGTPGWGWAIADTAQQAKDQALEICRQSAGGDRAPYCIVTQSVCDGHAT